MGKYYYLTTCILDTHSSTAPGMLRSGVGTVLVRSCLQIQHHSFKFNAIGSNSKAERLAVWPLGAVGPGDQMEARLA